MLLVRSATSVRKDLIDACPKLKIIGRGGVGMDNIDVVYARKKGITGSCGGISKSTTVSKSREINKEQIAKKYNKVNFIIKIVFYKIWME